MTDEERKEVGRSYEKPWYGSKKFIAFLLMELMLCAMSMVALFTQKELGWPLAAFMIGIVATMGSIALVFNGYQAKLDMFLRGIVLSGNAPRSTAEQLFGKPKKMAGRGDDESEDDQ